ncbi:hypothetical protein INT43_000207 [Umbelopsis isabellina]|uniref:Dilute domain-containing protein n=1 Tax=Mortierella isabellina TaxID=91625 RepID=A0A8H7PF86_MORIS|nr:hypothetical protein INT43_000207 [Umbelopsis isabellina]
MAVSPSATDGENKDVHKEYENMSYDEVSQKMAESYQQLSAMLGSNLTSGLASAEANTPASSAHSTPVLEADEFVNESMILNKEDLTEEDKQVKITRIFSRAASNGDVEKIKEMLATKELRTYIDIDARDEDGTTPLIYAACFGKVDVALALLDAGAKVNTQDKLPKYFIYFIASTVGWSALMWATNNNHNTLVKALLEHGASASTKSAKGRTVFDFVNTENQKIVEILATNPRDSISSTSSLGIARTGGSSSSSSSHADNDFYYQSTVEGFNDFMAEEADRHIKLMESAVNMGDFDIGDLSNDVNDLSLDNIDEGDDFDDPNGLANMCSNFEWDKCLPDQMFVFSADDLDYILDTIITNIQLPLKSRQELCVPANVLFLSARFAHYFSSDELLREVMDGALSRMSKIVKNANNLLQQANTRNTHILAFWTTNFTQLLYYLKKDTGLVVVTAEDQLKLSELISETYQSIIADTERRIEKILEPALLEHDQIPGMEEVNFADDWHRFFKRSSRKSSGGGEGLKRSSSILQAANSGKHASDNARTLSPKSITTLLTSTLRVLQSYEVHPTIIIQAIAQFFHYISCELFNRILRNKKLLCRSKALQIRMNISFIEDWVRHNRLPSSLHTYFNPLVQLLQLLQCLSQLTDLMSFINTIKKFDVLNALQVKRCVVNYRYEVNEDRVPEEVEKYALQLADDTTRYQKARAARKSAESARSRPSTSALSRTGSVSLQRSNSKRESFVGSLMSSVGITSSSPATPSGLSSPTTDNPANSYFPNNQSDISNGRNSVSMAEDSDSDHDEKDMVETKDSRFMLPFSVPTTANMIYMNGWGKFGKHNGADANELEPEANNEADSEHEEQKHFDRERVVVPFIPDNWMDKLDKQNAVTTD